MKTVLCHGVFDVLHIGHIKHLTEAKKYGDYLIVSVTADRFVKKGPGRPRFSAEIRKRMLEQLRIVDQVWISDQPTAIGAIKKFRPDFYIKGPDYKNASDDITGGIISERAAVEAYGGQLIITDTEVFSSSELINSHFSLLSDVQKAAVANVRERGGMPAIREVFEQILKLRVLVIGECIMDTYHYVRPQALSSKSPSISAEYVRTEQSYGGAWAITQHVKDFAYVWQIESGIVHDKERFIDVNTGQRLFEVTHINEESKTSCIPADYDMQIIADFGHGFLDKCPFPGSDVFGAVNVQTNSSNQGFNLATPWTNKETKFHNHYLTIDKRELQLAYRDRESEAWQLGLRAHREFDEPVAVTLGSDGCLLFHEEQIHRCPAFTDKVIDATGAGDAFFAITSLMMRVGADPMLTAFVGNVFAGLKTSIVGNARAVTKAELMKALEALLK